MLLLTTLAVLPAAALAFPLTTLTRRDGATCPSTSPLSCPAPSGVDTCCTNTPGGQLVLTQFWDYSPATGPADSWGIHGLWPDYCGGAGYPANCDSSREYTGAQIEAKLSQAAPSTLSYMRTYWNDQNGDDPSFWEHEWGKHGTCCSTLDLKCGYAAQDEMVAYFNRVVSLFKSLPTYQWLVAAGITPSTSKTYSLSQLQAVARANFGQEIVWNCRNGALNEAWYAYNTRGSIESGTFVPIASSGSTCPSTGIKWLPKGTTTTTTSAPASTSTSAPSGTKYLRVVQSSGSINGCLISTGKWMVGATCAGYTVSGSTSSSFTLSTSKGPCAIVSGAFSCASGQSATTFSSDSSGNLVYATRSQFHASSVPSGTTQVTVITSSANQAINLRLA